MLPPEPRRGGSTTPILPTQRLDAQWPAVGYEDVQWTPQLEHPGSRSREERRQQHGTYRAAIPPRIAELHPRLSAHALALADEASAEISRFDAELGTEIAPFAAVLLRSESASSSQIEHLTASAKAIALAELGYASRRNATEIVGNTAAMRAALEPSLDLGGDSILAMHRALMERSHPDLAGKWRTEPVWIGGSNHMPHFADFVPPRFELVPSAIDDLAAFMDRDDLPVLAQAAIAHAQFETVHPFPDGNGRTGRALLHSLLRGRKLTRHVTMPISAGLLTDTASYSAGLTAYRAGNVDAIIESMAYASFSAIGNGRQLLADLRSIRSGWGEQLTARRDSSSWKIVDGLARQPIMDTAYAQRVLGISESAAHRAFDELERSGIITEFSGMRRNRCWHSDSVLRALDGFAARAGRRNP